MSFAIIARLGLDTKDFESGLKRSQMNAKSLFRSIGTFFAVGGMAQAARSAIRLATDANEAAKALRETGVAFSELDKAKLTELDKTLQTWKNRALVTIGEVLTALQDFHKWDTGQGTNSAEAEAIAARKRAMAELSAEDKLSKPGAFGFRTIDNAAIEQRIQDILNENARKKIDERAEKEKQAAIDVGEARKKVEADVAGTVGTLVEQAYRDAKQAASPLAVQHAMIVQRMIEQNAIVHDTTKTEEDRIAAGKKLAELVGQQVKVQSQIAEKAKDEADEKKRAADESRKGAEQLANQQRQARDAFTDVTSMSIGDLAAGGRNLGGDSVRGARRVQRLEQQARQARSRGEADFADRLQGEAQDIRGRIPGLSSTERDLGKTASDQLVELKRLNDKIDTIGAKVGVAK
jgi:hypothetical protein